MVCVMPCKIQLQLNVLRNVSNCVIISDEKSRRDNFANVCKTLGKKKIRLSSVR